MNDALSEMLASLSTNSGVISELELSAPWGLRKRKYEGAVFVAVELGSAWLCLDDGTEPLKLTTGDVVFLPRGDSHRILNDPNSASIPSSEMLARYGCEPWRPGMRMIAPETMSMGGGGAITHLMFGVFDFRGHDKNPVLAALPKLILIAGKDGEPAPCVAATLRSLHDETRSRRPEGVAVTARLADILFMQAASTCISQTEVDHPGWLKGIADPQIGRAIACIHGAPHLAWTVASLATAAGMSRSIFAERFRRRIGCTPIEYLTTWRMQRAAILLASKDVLVCEASEAAGYQSELAFVNAFRRHFGVTPSSYRRGQNELRN